jgi:hypothetical protein
MSNNNWTKKDWEDFRLQCAIRQSNLANLEFQRRCKFAFEFPEEAESRKNIEKREREEKEFEDYLEAKRSDQDN